MSWTLHVELFIKRKKNCSLVGLSCALTFLCCKIFLVMWSKQHRFISRLDGASVTAGGFPPRKNNLLIITTSSNQVYAFDAEARQFGEWSMQHIYSW
jgi:hypothetical protein